MLILGTPDETPLINHTLRVGGAGCRSSNIDTLVNKERASPGTKTLLSSAQWDSTSFTCNTRENTSIPNEPALAFLLPIPSSFQPSGQRGHSQPSQPHIRKPKFTLTQPCPAAPTQISTSQSLPQLQQLPRSRSTSQLKQPRRHQQTPLPQHCPESQTTSTWLPYLAPQ